MNNRSNPDKKPESSIRAGGSEHGHAAVKVSALSSDCGMMRLRRTIGNQGVLNMLHTRRVQARLTMSRPDDLYEQEADRVADQVMRMPETEVKSQESGVGRWESKINSGNEVIQTKTG